MKRLDIVIGKINTNAGAFGADDFVYGGNMANWKKFAAALKIKLGINLADVDPALSKSAVESGYQLGTFANESESARIKYNSSGVYTSPAYRDLALSGRVDYCASDIYVAALQKIMILVFIHIILRLMELLNPVSLGSPIQVQQELCH